MEAECHGQKKIFGYKVRNLALHTEQICDLPSSVLCLASNESKTSLCWWWGECPPKDGVSWLTNDISHSRIHWQSRVVPATKNGVHRPGQNKTSATAASWIHLISLSATTTQRTKQLLKRCRTSPFLAAISGSAPTRNISAKVAALDLRRCCSAPTFYVCAPNRPFSFFSRLRLSSFGLSWPIFSVQVSGCTFVEFQWRISPNSAAKEATNNFKMAPVSTKESSKRARTIFFLFHQTKFHLQIYCAEYIRFHVEMNWIIKGDSTWCGRIFNENFFSESKDGACVVARNRPPAEDPRSWRWPITGLRSLSMPTPTFFILPVDWSIDLFPSTVPFSWKCFKLKYFHKIWIFFLTTLQRDRKLIILQQKSANPAN